MIIIIIYSINKKSNSDNSLIIVDGKINFTNMIRSKYSINSLFEDIRDIDDLKIRRVDCGVLKDGKLFCYFSNSYYKGFPIALIFNGVINYDGLKTIRKNTKWIYKMLSKSSVDFDNIFYAFYYRNSFYIIKK